MKWIGQNIYDQISRFRDHTYFEDSITLSTGKSITMDEYTSGTISITKIQDSGTEFNDNDTSLLTAAAVADKIEAYGYSTTAGDITSVVAGVGLSGGATSGAATLTVDFSEFSAVTPTNGDSLATLDSDGAAEQLTTVAALATLYAGTGLTASSSVIGVDASQTQITGVGTIGTGAWNATKILSTKTTHIIHYPFKGYCYGIASGNFQYSVNYQDAQSLFQMNFDYGDTVIADGSLDDVSDWFRSSGTIMPRAVTATRVYGWMTCPTTNDVTIALCKITPTRNDNSAVVPIVVATTVIAAIDNDKMDFFDITTSDAGAGTGSIVTSAIAQGDILMPFVISPNTKTTFFNLTLEVEA